MKQNWGNWHFSFKMIYSKLYTKLPPKVWFKKMCKEALNCWVQTSENWVKRSSTTLVYYSSYISERKERNLVTNKKKRHLKPHFLFLWFFWPSVWEILTPACFQKFWVAEFHILRLQNCQVLLITFQNCISFPKKNW